MSSHRYHHLCSHVCLHFCPIPLSLTMLPSLPPTLICTHCSHHRPIPLYPPLRHRCPNHPVQIGTTWMSADCLFTLTCEACVTCSRHVGEITSIANTCDFGDICDVDIHGIASCVNGRQRLYYVR